MSFASGDMCQTPGAQKMRPPPDGHAKWAVLQDRAWATLSIAASGSQQEASVSQEDVLRNARRSILGDGRCIRQRAAREMLATLPRQQGEPMQGRRRDVSVQVIVSAAENLLRELSWGRPHESAVRQSQLLNNSSTRRFGRCGHIVGWRTTPSGSRVIRAWRRGSGSGGSGSAACARGPNQVDRQSRKTATGSTPVAAASAIQRRMAS